jgi:hypothetical protein
MSIFDQMSEQWEGLKEPLEDEAPPDPAYTPDPVEAESAAKQAGPGGTEKIAGILAVGFGVFLLLKGLKK